MGRSVIIIPKIIKDVDKILKRSATELFIQYGYLNVDMKMISEKSGIAVGTLYHYYKNKQELYLSVLSESWEKTFIRLNEISASDGTPDEKLHKLIVALYYDMKERNGLGRVLFDNSAEELKTNDRFFEIKEKLLSSVSHILSNKGCGAMERFPENLTLRLTESLLVSVVAMIEFHPEDDTENINFLKAQMSKNYKS